MRLIGRHSGVRLGSQLTECFIPGVCLTVRMSSHVGVIRSTECQFYCISVAGTNGAVSVAGTLSSAVGGLVVGLAYYPVAVLCGREASVGGVTPPQWPLLVVTASTGLLGSLIDSVLGATLQYSGEYSFVVVCSTVVYSQLF